MAQPSAPQHVVAPQQAIYVPVAQAFPALAIAVPVPPPQQWEKHISPEIFGILSAVDKLTVRQHLKLLPKNCCGCPPCVKQENTFSVYAGLSQSNQAEFLRVDEVSDDWNRCCCAPYHPFRLEVRQYIPLPGDSSQSDYAHLRDEFRNDWGRYSARDQQRKARELYLQQPVLFSIARNDGQRCCYKCPCHWISTFVCFHCCQDAVFVYSGALADRPDGKEVGRHPQHTLSGNIENLIGSVVQPCLGGVYRPTLDLRDAQQDESVPPYAQISGPCFFGGWSEMCCDFQFKVSKYPGERDGSLAVVTKTHPRTLSAAATQLMSEADVYTISFNSPELSADQKVTILAGQLLVDYMYFEGSTEKCDQDDNFVYCNCCFSSCCGLLIPWRIALPKNGGN